MRSWLPTQAHLPSRRTNVPFRNTRPPTSAGTSNISVATSLKDVSPARAASSWPRPTSPLTWRKLGLKPAGDDGGWFQQFEFTSGVALGPGNELTANGDSYQVDKDWRPLSFSGTGEFESAPLVFAGYGIVADAAEQQEAYDSYVHLDVKDKWVVVFRYLPENISPEKRQQLNRPSQLRFKTTLCPRARGARIDRRDRTQRRVSKRAGPAANGRHACRLQPARHQRDE